MNFKRFHATRTLVKSDKAMATLNSALEGLLYNLKRLEKSDYPIWVELSLFYGSRSSKRKRQKKTIKLAKWKGGIK